MSKHTNKEKKCTANSDDLKKILVREFIKDKFDGVPIEKSNNIPKVNILSKEEEVMLTINEIAERLSEIEDRGVKVGILSEYDDFLKKNKEIIRKMNLGALILDYL